MIHYYTHIPWFMYSLTHPSIILILRTGVSSGVLYQMLRNKIEYGQKEYNRAIYTSPPVGRFGLRFAQVIPLRSIPTANLRYILSALVFALQSLYSSRQIAAYSRNVMYNYILNILKKILTKI
jgi:hypothetical protein